ncbi:hypothetical protein E2986_12542 [Frieseomelitta varia]|uniref:Spaetzle domain-containing protein n=1 Tax=Frieseomelitta varia TaxID=561572 RepID=A0A833W9Z3_9HYME|nr:hypothetical protein E2986_12542 [Frieseomelitta varia]
MCFCSRSMPDYSEGYDYPAQREGQFHSLPFLPPTQYPVRGHPPLVYGTPSNDTQQNGQPNCQLNCPLFIVSVRSYKYTTPTRRDPFLSDETIPVKLHSTEQRVTSDRPFYMSFGQDQTWWANRWSFVILNSTILELRMIIQFYISTILYVRSSKAPPRTLYENPLLKYSKSNKERNKRQSNPDAIPLCPTETQYITPRAALNNQGNWMYVVNLQDKNRKYSQVVKSEKCTMNVCNGICSVPAGYTSRCQQKFVQKRLVALEGSGNQLYTDVFWFPHGCAFCLRKTNNLATPKLSSTVHRTRLYNKINPEKYICVIFSTVLNKQVFAYGMCVRSATPLEKCVQFSNPESSGLLRDFFDVQYITVRICYR